MEIIQTDNAPVAIGPYSQAVVSNGFVFCSGQIALRVDATLVDGPVEVQFKQVMENLSAVLTAAGSSLDKVVKTTIYLEDMNDFQVVNELYANYVLLISCFLGFVGSAAGQPMLLPQRTNTHTCARGVRPARPTHTTHIPPT